MRGGVKMPPLYTLTRVFGVVSVVDVVALLVWLLCVTEAFQDGGPVFD